MVDGFIYMAWPVGVATELVILLLLNTRASASGCATFSDARVIADITEIKVDGFS